MISATNILSAPWRPSTHSLRTPAAFTLLEIIIVLGIAALVTGACIPAFLHVKTERELKEVAGALGNTILQARRDAITTAASVKLHIASDSFSYNAERFALKKGAKLRVRRPGEENWQTPDGRDFTIHSSGLCDSWQFEFSQADGSYLRTRVLPLSGGSEEEEFFIR